MVNQMTFLCIVYCMCVEPFIVYLTILPLGKYFSVPLHFQVASRFKSKFAFVTFFQFLNITVDYRRTTHIK